MKEFRESVAYLQGLAQGSDIDASTKEGKILISIIDALGEFNGEIDRINSKYSELEKYVDNIDAALAEVESDFYGNVFGMDEDEDFYNQEESFEILCPRCETVIDDAQEEVDYDFEEEGKEKH